LRLRRLSLAFDTPDSESQHAHSHDTRFARLAGLLPSIGRSSLSLPRSNVVGRVSPPLLPEAVAPGLLPERGLLAAVAVDVVDLDVSRVMHHPVDGKTVGYRVAKKAIRAALAACAIPMTGTATRGRTRAAQWLAVHADAPRRGRHDSGDGTATARFDSRQRPSPQSRRAPARPRTTCRCRTG
jgi:hypothetical protein